MMWKDLDWDLRHVQTQINKATKLRILDISKNIIPSAGKTLERRCLKIVEKRNDCQSCRQAGEQPVRLRYVRPQNGYIAVSCPWRLHGKDNVVSGKYHIEQDESIREFHVPQDVVLDRVTVFARTKDLPFWIDKLCIEQLEGSAEKHLAVHSMDLIYKESTLALGLISLRIDSMEQVKHLQDLLSGKCVTEKSDGEAELRYQLNIPFRRSREILKILYLIVEDIWWKRAWIFQEEYLSGRRMRLLIRSSVLKYPGSLVASFGDIPGELELSAIAFREQATRFCLAFRQCARLSERERRYCKTILQRVGKYTILLPRETTCNGLEAMSPTILEEIGRRNITCISDILAIASNSCDYSERLDPKKFGENDSLSLAVLTAYLLNGEILGSKSMTRMSWAGDVFQYLKWNSLRIEPPLQEKGLTFIKHCRFPNVKLTRNGMVTEGIIWNLGRTIETRLISTSAAGMADTYRKIKTYHSWNTSLPHLEYNEHEALWLLVDWLLGGEDKSYWPLADLLINFLDNIAPQGYDEDWSGRHIMYMMSIGVARAIQSGRHLRLGAIARGTAYSPYTAIFIVGRCRQSSGGYAFTSWAQARESIEENILERSCSKYASLEVDCDGATVGVARIVPKRWLSGLCFFQNIIVKEVVVRWPEF